ncbi:GNAT family N-acetyltransferase [Comamonas endophytica]|uniref:GNAT family N-acetyltransferase n=1 Tax=Comamonas endophytica TaxID=2949090 RepID=A0ABY6G841_9BURK|nr:MULTISPECIES: GNAT family N-acetyltransferase [unclassified Acidovorax]MCD2514064.1 GNAT family N-acetyltransferase [Acidovorax sp. D4N7]UYG51207.1 GNAT family N-acetyltransferase [Acidovorax sp. 5MLIR]
MTSQKQPQCGNPRAARVARLWRTSLAGEQRPVHGTSALRPVRAEDAQAVVTLAQQTFLDAPDEALAGTFRTTVPAILAGHYGHFIDAASFVHESSAREIDGAILVGDSPTYGGPVIGLIAVAKLLQGQGMGGMLVSHSLAALQQLGYAGCCARITVGHLRSERLFRRLGFKPVSN